MNSYHKPAELKEALTLAKANSGKYKFLAGGTDVIVNKFQGNETAGCLIDLTGIASMREIRKEKNTLVIGSLVRLEELERSDLIRKMFPALAEAAHAAASPMLRKTATLGGNLLCENRCIFYNQSAWWREAAGYCLKCEGDICIATGGSKACFSKFVSDTAPVLIALHASVNLVTLAGKEKRALEKIYTNNGLTPRSLPADAIIESVEVPAEQPISCAFRKLRPREAVDFTSLTTAVSSRADGTMRMVAGGVDPGPVMVEGKISEREALIKTLVKKCRIVDNDIYSRSYRKEMIGVFLEDKTLAQ